MANKEEIWRKRIELYSLGGTRYGYYKCIRHSLACVKSCLKALDMGDIVPEIETLEARILEGLTKWYWKRHADIARKYDPPAGRILDAYFDIRRKSGTGKGRGIVPLSPGEAD